MEDPPHGARMRRSKRPFGLYQQPWSKVWWCRIRGVRQTTGEREYDAALVEAAKRTATPTHATPHKASLERAYELFLAAKRAAKRAAGTFDMYRKKYGHLARVFQDPSDVNAITRERVHHFINKRRKEGAGETTLAKELSTLTGILWEAKYQGHFRGDVLMVVPRKLVDPESKPRKTFHTASQFDCLLAELEPHRAAAAAFLVAAACRDSDMERAQMSDLTVKPGHIRVHATKTKRNREGERFVHVNRLNADLVKRIKRWTAGRTGKLFVRWTNIQRDLAKACERASACARCRHTREQRRSEGCRDCARVEIVPRVSPNDLRRTAATWLYQDGVEPHLIGKVLGHGDGRMTEKVYGQMTPEDLGRLLDERLSRSPVRLAYSGRGRRRRGVS